MSDWQERLGEAITARGITGGELARRTGFSAQYINSMRNGDRGARLPLDTARRLAHALGVSVEWLTSGTGNRERLSDVYPTYNIHNEATPPPESATIPDRYPGRAEAVALLVTTVEPEVIVALRAVVPEDPAVDPGREWWIAYSRTLVRDLRRIKNDPLLSGASGAPGTARPEGGPGAEPPAEETSSPDLRGKNRPPAPPSSSSPPRTLRASEAGAAPPRKKEK